ncbi:MAG: DUF1571 domain-containing protein [Planctomycetes bacterium]|nr:DUF1571 domain-containing protein [Planctomycetota bacterium]
MKRLLTMFAGLFFIAGLAAAGCQPPGGPVVPRPQYSTTRPAGVSDEIDRLARTDQIALLEKCLAGCGKYADYACLFIKQERVGGNVKDPQWVDVRFRAQPFSVAMAWRDKDGDGNRLPLPPGDRLIYIEGQYDGKMLVRPSGLFRGLTVKKDPEGDEAMANSLRPVTMFGFERGLKNLLDVYVAAKKTGDLKCSFGGYWKIDGRDSLVLVRDLPQKPGYPAKTTTIFIDAEWLVATKIEATEWDDKFQSSYEYRQVRFNVGLKDADFTPESNGMKPVK